MKYLALLREFIVKYWHVIAIGLIVNLLGSFLRSYWQQLLLIFIMIGLIFLILAWQGAITF